MAKRGRPRKGAEERRSVMIGARVAPDLKARLDESAQRNNVSLAQEIERRLRLRPVEIAPDLESQVAESAERNGVTFSEEINRRLRLAPEVGRVVDWFGGYENYNLFRLFSLAMSKIHAPITLEEDGRGLVDHARELLRLIEERREKWSNDPYVFFQTVLAINFILTALRPDGEHSVPREDDAPWWEQRVNWMGIMWASDMIEAVANQSDKWDRPKDEIFSRLNEELRAGPRKLRGRGLLGKFTKLMKDQEHAIERLRAYEPIVEEDQ